MNTNTLKEQLAALDRDLEAIAARGKASETALFDDKLAERKRLADQLARHEALDRAAGDPRYQDTVREPGVRTTVGTQTVRDAALRRVESTRNAPDGWAHSMVDLLDQERDQGRGDQFAKWAYTTSNPNYRSAFGKLLRDPEGGHREFSSEELDAFRNMRELSRTMNLGSGAAGSYLVPSMLDPAILLTGTSIGSPIVNVARTVTIATTNWVGVSSAGVTASWDAENAEVSDDSPTLAQPTIATHKGAAFVAASIEATEDSMIGEQVAALFADARDRLEGAAFATGSGNGQPKGVFTALEAITNAKVVTTTAAAIGEVDLHATYEALGARYRPNSTWLTAPKWALAVKRLGTNIGSTFSGDLTQAPLTDILGRPVIVDDNAPVVVTTASQDSRVVLADFSNYVIVRRVGMSVEFIPHLFHTSNNRPSGTRGWYAYWRTGADLVNGSAGVLLVDKTG